MDDSRSKGPRETSTTIQALGEDGILRVRLKPGAEVDLAAASESLRVTDELVGDGMALVLVDARPARSISREARVAFADPVGRRNTKAQAILIDSGVSRVMGNFFLGLNRPEFPVQLFTDEAEAITWLEGFLTAPDDATRK